MLHNGLLLHLLCVLPVLCAFVCDDPCQAKYRDIERRFQALDKAVSKGHPHYRKRMCGIASTGRGYNYKQLKTRFVYDSLLAEEAARGEPLRTVCEVGFNAGHSSMLFLEALPAASVTTFDVPMPWGPWGRRYLQALYGHRFRYVEGKSVHTIPAFREKHPEFSCQVVFIDGSKQERDRYLDVVNFRQMSSLATLVYLDEINTVECVNGTVPRNSSLCSPAWEGASLAYNSLAREGQLVVSDCVFPKEGDGTCTARYLK